MLETEETDDTTEAIVQQLQNRIEEHNVVYPMESFHIKNTKDTRMKKRKRLNGDVDDPGAGGSVGGVDATDCAQLRAHGYDIEPRDVIDERGNVIIKVSYVRQPLSTYAPR